MAYTINPYLPKVRRDAVRLVKYRNWSMCKVARHIGVNVSTISRWCKKDFSGGWHEIPTLSSRPKKSPKALPRDVVNAIIKERVSRRRCAEHVYHALKTKKINVSLSSVKRTLDRCHLTKKRSPWKRPHDFTSRPLALYSGALLQCDTIHIIAPDGGRIYVYTLIDLYSRWAYAEVVEKIGAEPSVKFIAHAQKEANFKFKMIQTDNGPEFSKWCTHGWLRLGISHRHGRVRKSNDQAHVERFNRTVQEECLDRVANSIFSFKKVLPEYLKYYNNERTHMGINYLTPLEMLQRC
jgi:transposase InsO family protein